MQKSKPGNGPAKEYQNLFEPMVCIFELVKWQCEVPELQMLINCLGLTDATILVNFHFLVFRSFEKDNPCNKLSL